METMTEFINNEMRNLAIKILERMLAGLDEDRRNKIINHRAIKDLIEFEVRIRGEGIRNVLTCKINLINPRAESDSFKVIQNNFKDKLQSL